MNKTKGQKLQYEVEQSKLNYRKALDDLELYQGACEHSETISREDLKQTGVRWGGDPFVTTVRQCVECGHLEQFTRKGVIS